jgi:hypothetical protein
MTRQNPDFGPVNAAIQQLGTFQLQISALGFGKPRTDPAEDREIRTDANGLVWQYNETNSNWVFIGKSLQPYLGAPLLEFYYYGGDIEFTVVGANGGNFFIREVRGYHSWPTSSEALLRLPNNFTAPAMNKLINTGASWSSGNNGNLYFLPPSVTFSATTDSIFAVFLIRRESDGLVDYCAIPQNGSTETVNTRYLINGVGWRIGGLVGHLFRDGDRNRFLGCSQRGKTTYLSENKMWTNFTPSTDTIPTASLPVGRRGFEVALGPRNDTSNDWVRISNSSTGTGFPLIAHLRPNSSARYLTPYRVSSAGELFTFSAAVNSTAVRLVYWENEYLAKLGF